MTTLHPGWTKAHHDVPLHHDARDNAGLPTPRDQGESAGVADKQKQAETKYHENEKSREAKMHGKSEEQRAAMRAEWAKEDIAKQPEKDPTERNWGTRGTPKAHV